MRDCWPALLLLLPLYLQFHRRGRMTPRINETPEEFKDRRRQWYATRRTTNKSGDVTSQVEVPCSTIEAAKIENGVLARTSTLFDAEGHVRLQWQVERPEHASLAHIWQRALEAAKTEIVKVPAAPLVERLHYSTKYRTIYGVGDHHFGMYAWHRETLGADYDLKIAENLLVSAFQYLLRFGGIGEDCVIPYIGDLTHYDSMKAQTPTGHHLLDADGRMPLMIQTTIRAVRRIVTMALQVHRNVYLIFEIGNHDESHMPWMAQLFSIIFENEPRVIVDTSPAHFHYHQFHACLLGTHHGHGRAAKPQNLPMIMAHDRPEEWGATRHRFWLTGHIHTKRIFEYPGCMVETLGILPPNDAHGAHEGYRSGRRMEAIILDAEDGEIARYPVHPRMLERLCQT